MEQLWIATEEEGRPGWHPGTGLSAGAEALIQEGLASPQSGLLVLTAEGRRAAAQAIRRHRLAERLLADVLCTEERLIDEQACRLEHSLLDGLSDSICTLLGHPQFCPHGRPIPRGQCCRQMRDSVDKLIASLCELQPGQEGRIAYLQMNNPRRLQKLMAMGILPGTCIKLLRRSPSFVFETGFSQFAVDEEIAADIYVRLSQAP